MAISNARHIFQNALGAVPTPEQEKDIDGILRTLQDCGLPVDDRTQAPLIIDLAWRWARIPRNADARDAVRGPILNLGVLIDAQTKSVQDLAKAIEALQKAPTPEPAPTTIDHVELAGRIAQAMPQQSVKIDLAAIKESISEATSNFLLAVAAAVVVATAGVSFYWGKSSNDQVTAQQQAQIKQQQETIDRLTAGGPRKGVQ